MEERAEKESIGSGSSDSSGSSGSSGQDDNQPPGTKVIFLIRHAESQNNVAKRDTANVFRRWRRGEWSWPNATEWASMTSLLAVPMDTDLSADGVQQAQALQQQLEAARFLENEGIQLIVHSHLIRARRTCHTVFASALQQQQQTSSSVSADGEQEAESPASPVIVQHDAIYEKSITEHVGTADLAHRTQAFVQWLRQRPETRMVVVGHSAFFRELLRGYTVLVGEGTEENDGGANDDDGGGATRVAKMDNCEVRRVELLPNGRFAPTTKTVVAGGKALLNE